MFYAQTDSKQSYLEERIISREVFLTSPTNHPFLYDLYADWDPEPRWMGGVNWAGSLFYGSIDIGANFFGSTLADSEYVEVMVRFSSAETTYCQTYRRDLGYPAAGVGIFRGSAWDISDPSNPRRLNLCFVEDSLSKPSNHLWDPDTSSLGGREYLFIMLSDYDSTGQTYDDNNWGPTADVVFAWWPRLEPGHPFFETDPAELNIRHTFFRNFRAVPEANRIWLTWKYIGHGIDHVRLYYGTDSPSTLLDSFPTTTKYYIHDGLDPSQHYFYRLEGVDSSGFEPNRSPKVIMQPQSVSQYVDLQGLWHEKLYYYDLFGYIDSFTNHEYLLVNSFLEDTVTTVAVLDLADTIPNEISTIALSSDVYDVTTFEHYGVIFEWSRFSIFDLADPTNPVLLNTTSMGNSRINDGVMSGHYLYLTTGNTRFQIYNLSQPGNPVAEGFINLGGNSYIHVRNDTAWVIGNNNKIHVVDVSNKSQPTLITNIVVPNGTNFTCWLSKDGNYLFVSRYSTSAPGFGIGIIDVNDVFNPVFLQDFVIDPSAYIAECMVKEDYLFVAHHTQGIRIIDVSDPTTPQEVGYYDTDLVEEHVWSGCIDLYPFFQGDKVVALDHFTGVYILRLDSTAVEINEPPQQLPQTITLYQNYPNPFNPVTTIEFSLPRAAHTRLEIFNILGEKVVVLVDGKLVAGHHQVNWEAGSFASGVYFYRLTVNNTVKTRKMLLLR